MKFSNSIISRLNIQIFIIFINIEYIMDTIYILADGVLFEQTNNLMSISSIVNLLISLFLYGMYIKNRIDLDKLMENTETNTIQIINKVGKELNYILINLIIFFIYSIVYLVYIFGVLLTR